jgi:hypothetical protein
MTSVPGYWRDLIAPRDRQYAAHDRTRSVVLIQVNEECRDSTLYFFALRTSEELKMAPSDDNHSGIRRSDFLRGVAAAGIAAGVRRQINCNTGRLN